jgi:acyl-coenzyme A synthetase/AMP-(fatty) acid ligase
MFTGCSVGCLIHQVCFLWEGNNLDEDAKMTYKEVLEAVCQLVRNQDWSEHKHL